MVLEILKELATFATEAAVLITAIAKLLDSREKKKTNVNRILLRYMIVSFASDLHKGVPKTRDEFLSIFEQIDEYKNICDELNVKNHLFENECAYIDKCFQSLDILNKGKLD